jgi:hypothetical protein
MFCDNRNPLLILLLVIFMVRVVDYSVAFGKRKFLHHPHLYNHGHCTSAICVKLYKADYEVVVRIKDK